MDNKRIGKDRVDSPKTDAPTMVGWIVLGALSGVLAGFASTLFLVSLAWATYMQATIPGLLWLMPVGGFCVTVIYHHWGGVATQGNNAILTESRCLQEGVPLRMAPLVLGGTLITHLFGGSAGREGTAIQMAGSLTDTASRLLKVQKDRRQIILQASIAGGFASVFGTPFAGSIFALEVLRGRPRWRATVPSVVAAFVGDAVTRLFVSHTDYARPVIPIISLANLAKVAVAGIAFGLTAILFVEMLRGTKKLFCSIGTYPPLGTAIGGVVIIGLTLLVGTRDYNGLGIPVIEAAVAGAPHSSWAFLKKTLFTAVTIGSGFQGGEVTPLFFIGATLGNALAHLIDLGPGLLAAIGFVAVFSGAVNAPLACTVMGMELFGVTLWPYLLVACIISYFVSGRRSIYDAQLLPVDDRGIDG